MTRNSPRRLTACMLAMTAILCQAAAPAHEVHHQRPDRDRSSAAAPAPRAEPAAGQMREPVHELLRAFRRTGDDRHLDRAWMSLAPALADGPRDHRLLIDAALVAQARHRFDLALELVHEALAARPRDDQAWLLLASIRLVRGEADAAETACRRLRAVPALVRVTCHARVAHARGAVDGARDRLEGLLAVPAATALQDEWLAWSLSVAGDLAMAAERPRQAAERFRRSLALVESVQVRAALVDALLAAGEAAAAAAALDGAAVALPLQVRRLVVAAQMGQAEPYAPLAASMDATFRRWIADEDWLHAREMARYYLDVAGEPALARRLARINLELQREPEDLLLGERSGL